MRAPLFHLACLTLFLFIGGCSSSNLLLNKQDYEKSERHFTQGNADEALLNFPRYAERGNFITTMEKAYLNLIQGKSQISQLQQQVESLENRVRYHVSREAKTFFYLQTPEDYYASEHEVIWLHFLLSWGYSLQGKYESACVEARVASSLLSLPWSPGGHFDDPFMRVFLSGLWTMCGNWAEAQVDLRAAWYLDNKLTWALELAQHKEPPANLFLILGGPGPEVAWNPEFKLNPLRSNRQISFNLRGKKSALTITDNNGQRIKAQISPDASRWYERHLERESELHELIMDSAFGGKATTSGALASGKIAANTGLGVLVGVGGTALGAAIANAGVKSGSDDTVKYGLITAAASITWGWEIISDGYHSSIKAFKEDIDPSTQYRFVRFLPEYLWLAWTDQKVSYPVELKSASGAQTFLFQPITLGFTSVGIGFIPDKQLPTYYYRNN